jgi:hypothetical protein
MAETVATYSVPEHHVKMFSANVQAALTKKGGLLLSYVSQGSYTGERSQVVSFLGPVEFVERNTPYGDTKLSEVEHTQRWITGAEYDCAILIDRLDTLKMIYDPTSPYVERMREAAARKQDEIIMSKFFAVAKTGKDGTTNTAFPAGNIVAHGSTRFTVAKLRAMRKLMKKRHLDLRSVKPYIAVTAEQIDDLLGETSVTSSDYAAVKALVDGEVGMFMGFIFVQYEDGSGAPTTDGGKSIPAETVAGPATIRNCPVWVPDGMHFGSWSGLDIIISPRPDKNNIKQAHATFTAGATRLDENKVFQLNAVESGTPS